MLCMIPLVAGSLAGLLRAAHPFPTAAVVSLTALIGVASAGDHLDESRLGLLLVAMLLSQLVIGWTNDYLDRDTDRHFQPEKPIPAGEVAASILPPATVLAGFGLISVGLALGPLTLSLLIVGTAAGLVYDFGVKATRLSWTPYVVGLAVLPAYVWSGLDVYRDELLWLYLLGTPLALAAHTANVLPDIELDRRAGGLGIGVKLGRRNALLFLACCMLAPVVLLPLTFPILDYELEVLGATLVAYITLSLSAGYAYREGVSHAREVMGFRLIALASVVFTAGWLASF